MADRISQLPSEILHQILSLLPVKSIARAGVLSHRWNHLFKSLQLQNSVLDFGENFASGKPVQEFVGSVNLHLRISGGSKVKRFNLFFYPSIEYMCDLEKWFKCVVNQGVEELELDFCLDYGPLFQGEFLEAEKKRFKLPACVFGCNSLTHVKISRSDFSIPLDFPGFSSLRELYLYTVNITDEMLERIIFMCSSLKTLNLRECFDIDNIRICGPDLQLKFLSIMNCICFCKMEIYAPRLRSFHFNGDSLSYEFANISSLEDAIICAVGVNAYDFDENRTMVLAKMSHIKILTICGAALRDIVLAEENEPQILPIAFHKILELQILLDYGLQNDYLTAIYCFFRHCTFPCLEKLFIELGALDFECIIREDAFFRPGVPPEQMFINLKIAKIYSFSGHRNEISLVKFLLAKSIALEYLILVAPQSNESETIETQMSTVLEELLSFPRANSEAQISLCEYAENDKSLCPTHTKSQYAPSCA